jgi:hypothetical protein
MIEPTESDIGRKVIYRDLNGRGKIEEGTITLFNDQRVFVRYTTGSTSAATRRGDLEWSHRQPSETAISTTVRGGKTVAIDFCDPPIPSDWIARRSNRL